MNSIFEKLKTHQHDDIFDLAEYKLGYNQAFEDIQEAYNSLCPKPSEFGYKCNFFSIDADSESLFWVNRPELSIDCWINTTSKIHFDDTAIPLGLDWRLCCWSLEDAKRIHGEE